jgi:hypothetical protein
VKWRTALATGALALAAGCSKPIASEAPGQPRFRDAAAETDLQFRHFTGAAGRYYMPEIMGAGVALFDFDNDGDLDVFLMQGTMLDPGKRPDQSDFPPPPGCRLLRNELVLSGQLHFTDVTGQAGVDHVGYGMGVATGDYDNDGFQDLYLTNFGHNVLYHNNGDGTFTDVTARAGVDDERWSTSAAFFDYDGDGKLDLIVLNYVDFTVKGNKPCTAPTGEPDYCTPKVYHPAPARLFRNLGEGRFADVTLASGIGAAFGPGLGVVAADFNGDGRSDLYVANDTAANLLWINQGNGRFEETGLPSGAAYAADGLARAGMGIAAGDFDNDGLIDLLVTNLSKEGATLFRNDGKGFFYDASLKFGITGPTFNLTGFGTGWLDYDNDGRLDLFIANGAVTIMEGLRGNPYPFRQRKLLLHNEGRTFRDVTAQAGGGLQDAEVSRGAAFGDINNDGAIDIVVTNNDGPARLFLNETAGRGHWTSFRLQGQGANRDAIGARIEVRRRGGPSRWGRVHTDGSYLSAGDLRVHFGLGDRREIEAVVVYWPNGSIELWDNIRADRQITLRQGTGRPQ